MSRERYLGYSENDTTHSFSFDILNSGSVDSLNLKVTGENTITDITVERIIRETTIDGVTVTEANRTFTLFSLTNVGVAEYMLTLADGEKPSVFEGDKLAITVTTSGACDALVEVLV